MKILELDQNPDAQLHEFAMVIESDTAISSQLLKYCNSPVSGIPREISNIRQAIAMIGLRSTKMIALSFSLLRARKSEATTDSFDFDRFWQNSITTGIAARYLASAKGSSADLAFVLGIMVRTGWLAVRQADSKSYQELTNSATNDFEFQQKSREIYGMSLYELGASLLDDWGFPENFVEAIRNSETLEMANEKQSELGQILYVSRNVADLITESEYREPVDKCREMFEKLLDSSSDSVPDFGEMFDTVCDQMREYLDFLEMDMPEVRQLWEIENEAKQILARLTMELQKENQEIARQNRMLAHETNTDPLTGLNNRRSFETRAVEEVSRAVRNERQLGLLVIDIDDFKAINDTYGHLLGDEAIRSVAEIIRQNIRKYDYSFRYGGEEFVIIVPETEFKDVCKIAERLRASVEQLELKADDQAFSVTVSIGISYLKSGENAKWEELFEEADAKVYEAKQKGRNMVCSA